MRVLVAYGSRMGGTAGIADMLGEALVDAGLDVDVRTAGEVASVDGYEAVVLGGSLYAMRWHRDARRFIRRFAADLKGRPTWLFSSGPLDDSASARDLPPAPTVASLARRIGARGHRTFGGMLTEETATGLIAKAMAKNTSGDWRDPHAIRAWAEEIARELQATPVA